MSSAGHQFVANHIPGERIATEVITVDSAGFTTTETDIASITAPLVTGRTYRVTACLGMDIDATGVVRLTIYEDTSAGTRLTLRDLTLDAAVLVAPARAEVEFTAASTGNKTFQITGDVISGAGTANINASADFPSYVYVDYIRE